MIKDRDIVCLSFVTWDDHWGTPQQLMSRLAKHNRVLFVDQPVSPMSFLTGIRRRSAVALQLKRWRQGYREVAKNVYAAAPPPILPLRYHRFVNRLNAIILRRWLARQARLLGFRDPIFWNFQPSLPGLARSVRPSLSVYHCVDEFAAVPYWYHSAASSRAREAECCREADLIFCTGRTLVEWRRAMNPNTHFVGNAGNYDLFAQAALDGTQIPDDAARLPGKVIGMLGVIDFRLDVGLIEHLATQRPDWSLALVGLVKGDAPLSRLQALPNVHVMGFKPMEQLPGYLKRMDVCLVPYALNEYTHHIFPLKLYDYMAAGKPIIASDMAELREDDGNGYTIAHSPDEFIRAIEQAMDEDTPERAAARRELARQNTWDHRVEEISDVIASAGGTQASSRSRQAPLVRSMNGVN